MTIYNFAKLQKSILELEKNAIRLGYAQAKARTLDEYKKVEERCTKTHGEVMDNLFGYLNHQCRKQQEVK